jgi:hypothetical protein
MYNGSSITVNTVDAVVIVRRRVKNAVSAMWIKGTDKDETITHFANEVQRHL